MSCNLVPAPDVLLDFGNAHGRIEGSFDCLISERYVNEYLHVVGNQAVLKYEIVGFLYAGVEE